MATSHCLAAQAAQAAAQSGVPSLEHAFLQGKFVEVITQGEPLLTQLLLEATDLKQHMDDGRESGAMKERLSRVQGQYTRLLVLLIQCFYETREYEGVDRLVTSRFASELSLPVEVFFVWVQFQLALPNRFETTCRTIVRYIQARGRQELTADQYDALVELAVFHCLIPLNNYEQALTFLRDNTRLTHKKKKYFLRAVKRLARTEKRRKAREQGKKTGERVLDILSSDEEEEEEGTGRDGVRMDREEEKSAEDGVEEETPRASATPRSLAKPTTTTTTTIGKDMTIWQRLMAWYKFANDYALRNVSAMVRLATLIFLYMSFRRLLAHVPGYHALVKTCQEAFQLAFTKGIGRVFVG